jgi:hypothetical protein
MTHPPLVDPLTEPPRTEAAAADSVDLADSLDIRLLLAGRLSPSTVQVRHDRVELATVLEQRTRPG